MSKVPSKQKMRHNARQAAMQALYQWQYAMPSTKELVQQFLAAQDKAQLDVSYFEILVEGAIKQVDAIDANLAPLLDRDIASLNPVELAILRVSAYELMHQLDVPYRVVINEALELAKTFGAEQGYKYVNAILDKLSVTLRPTEIKNKKGS